MNYELNRVNYELNKVSTVPCQQDSVQPQSVMADADELEQPRSISFQDDDDDNDWDDDDDDDD